MKNQRKLKPNFVLLVAVLVLTITACEKGEKNPTETTKINVSNIVSTDCLNENGNGIKGIYESDSVFFSYQDGTLNVTHYNLSVNCGFDSVTVNVQMSGDTIIIDEYGYPDNQNCVCDINNSFQINNIPRGMYTIIMRNWTPSNYQQTINF